MCAVGGIASVYKSIKLPPDNDILLSCGHSIK